MKRTFALFLVVCMVLCSVPNMALAAEYTVGNYTYEILHGGIVITSCDKTVSGNVVVPYELDGRRVVEIGPNAFENCVGITHVSLPACTQGVDYGAFLGCSSLKSVVFNNNITMIKTVGSDSATLPSFTGCTSLEKIYGFANSTAEEFAMAEGLEFVPIAKVMLNGTALDFDVPPQIINGRTMVPMRKIFESLGAEVEWDNDTRTVTSVIDNTVIIMQIDNYAISVNGEEIVLDVPPMIVNDRTLVPVRAASESLGAVVEWRDETKTVIITTEEEKDVFDSFEERIKTTQKTKMGDAFYNWSIDIPKEVEFTTLSGDGVYFEFSSWSNSHIVSLHVLDADGTTIAEIQESETDYVSGYTNGRILSQSVEKTKEGAEFVRTVYEYDHNMYGIIRTYRGDSRMFLHNGYLYSLYVRCPADVDGETEKYKAIADSFSFSYDENVCEPLQRIENGFRWYSDTEYKVGFYVPADWKITKMDNQLVFLSDELENAESIGMIGFSVFSVTEGESLEEYVQKNKAAYKGLYETAGDAYTQSDVTEIDMDGNAGICYTDEINLPDLKIYRKDMYFYLGDYVYNLQLQFKNVDSSIADSVINSFIAIELDKNKIGYIEPYPAG